MDEEWNELSNDNEPEIEQHIEFKLYDGSLYTGVMLYDDIDRKEHYFMSDEGYAFSYEDVIEWRELQ